jgi:hypothetical protein
MLVSVTEFNTKHPHRILVTGARAPAALHIARLLTDAGCHVFMSDTLRWPFSNGSRACIQYYRFRSPVEDWERFCFDIVQLINDNSITHVIPTCEEVFHLARLWKDLKPTASLFAPKVSTLLNAHNKLSFIQRAADLGLEVPDTRLLLSPDDIQKSDHTRVLKPIWSRFAEKVFIQPNSSDLQKIKPSAAAPWISQEFLEGEEICAFAFAKDGNTLGISAYHPLYRAGKGAAIYFKPVATEIVAPFVQTYIEGENWTGQISFDLIRMKDGKILPLECNPRSTSGIHFFRDPTSFCSTFLCNEQDGPEADLSISQSVPLAMLSYGLVEAIRRRKFRHWISDLQNSRSAMKWPNDAIPIWRQFLTIMEFTLRSLHNRTSLLEATTSDIRWDGDPKK